MGLFTWPHGLRVSCPKQLRYPVGYFSASTFNGGLLNINEEYIPICILHKHDLEHKRPSFLSYNMGTRV